VTCHQRGLTALALQLINDQGFDDEQRRLGVAGVVQIGWCDALSDVPPADGEQISPQELGRQLEALLGSGEAQDRIGHADFLRPLTRKHPGNRHALRRNGSGSLSGTLPTQQRSSPAQPCAKSTAGEQVARANASPAHGLIQHQGNGGR